jgi:hypothetical protein
MRAPSTIGTREAGRILGVSPRRVRRLVELGRLSAVALSPRALALDRGEVERLAAQDRPAGRPAKAS